MTEENAFISARKARVLISSQKKKILNNAKPYGLFIANEVSQRIVSHLGRAVPLKYLGKSEPDAQALRDDEDYRLPYLVALRKLVLGGYTFCLGEDGPFGIIADPGLEKITRKVLRNTLDGYHLHEVLVGLGGRPTKGWRRA